MRSEERRVGKECRSLCDWSSDVCSSDLLASKNSIVSGKARQTTMEMDDHTKQLAEEVGTAINESVQQSPTVAAAIERLREAGFEMELTLRLEIGLRAQREGEPDGEASGSLELTDEDMRVLQAMKIKIDSEE